MESTLTYHQYMIGLHLGTVNLFAVSTTVLFFGNWNAAHAAVSLQVPTNFQLFLTVGNLTSL